MTLFGPFETPDDAWRAAFFLAGLCDDPGQRKVVLEEFRVAYEAAFGAPIVPPLTTSETMQDLFERLRPFRCQFQVHDDDEGGVIRHAPSDGRAFTNYLSRCEFENNLMQNFAVGSQSQYRAMLQNQAKTVNDRAKLYVQAQPYWSTTTCPKAADAHAQMIANLSKRR